MFQVASLFQNGSSLKASTELAKPGGCEVSEARLPQQLPGLITSQRGQQCCSAGAATRRCRLWCPQGPGPGRRHRDHLAPKSLSLTHNAFRLSIARCCRQLVDHGRYLDGTVAALAPFCTKDATSNLRSGSCAGSVWHRRTSFLLSLLSRVCHHVFHPAHYW